MRGSRVPELLRARLRLPLIGSPMFLVSAPALVVAQCRAGIVGVMPSLNIRPPEQLENEIARMQDALDDGRSAPMGINLIAHKTNPRLEHDLAACIRRKVPVIVTSLGPSAEIVRQVHSYGGIVLHDVINMRHARKAIAAGVDGVVAVCAGAGGHGGTLSPFAFVRELRQEFDGMIVLSGAISDGHDILGATAMGADLAYMGSRFIATQESAASPEYKQMVLDAAAGDIVYSDMVTGIHGNYLAASMLRAGLDPAAAPAASAGGADFSEGNSKKKAWRDIWGAGQGVGTARDIPTVAELVTRFAAQFREAQRELTGESWRFAG
ncbi:MAG: nitronate monooxygenase [Rhizobiaceae bacterium]|nr:nitronate monooxygenase [Rhizobiaceae bacterium]